MIITPLQLLPGMALVVSLSTATYSRIGETLDEVIAHYGEPLATEV